MQSVLRILRRVVLSLGLCAVMLPAGDRLHADNPLSVPPKREMRGVWITTVASLDWPPSNDPAEQRQSLEEMVDRLAAANFNAIFFQVRGRADAMYRSRYEPWSAQLTGTLGKDPGWDPLATLIALAHNRGMEVHAWFNTFLVKTGGPRPSSSRPEHLLLAHPEWVRDSNGETWCDPGLPQVRRYLVEVALDIVRRYDIDGIQFDYVRYPARQFPDEPTFRRYGGGLQRDEWRRQNVNLFVREFHDSLIRIRPGLAAGATPVGIYNAVSGAKGLRGYTDVCQDSRLWLREGWIDYLIPQIYWPLSDTKSEPNFLNLSREWAQNSAGREIAIGMGAYKPEVLSQLPVMIDSARRSGAAGVVFFRYDNIRNVLSMSGRFRSPALLPALSWKDSIPPDPPPGLKMSDGAGDVIELRWSSPEPAADGDRANRYCVYRSSTSPVDISSSLNCLAVLPAGVNRFFDTITRATAPGYFYAVTSVDRSWNESSPSLEKVVLPAIAEMSREFAYRTQLGTLHPGRGSSELFVPYELRENLPVIIRILDDQNREVAGVVDAVQKTGRYIVSADISGLPRGKYTCLMLAGNSVLKRPFSVGEN